MQRKRGFITIGILMVILLLIVGAVQAAPMGTAFTYQGRLDDNGQPANGFYDFQFRLFDAGSGGNQLGVAAIKEDIPVAKGLFTIPDLDFGSGIFNGEARWLEIGVRLGGNTGSFTVLSPLQAMTATPYALYAANAPDVGQGAGILVDANTVSADTTYLQRRVSSTCAAGSAIRVINTDGTVTCQTDTNYSAGVGLNLIGTAFSANFGGSGAATQVARSDHNHLGQTWTGSNNPLIITGSFEPTDSAALMVSNSGFLGDGISASSVGGDGVSGLSTGGTAADNGVYGETNSTTVTDAGVKGVSTSSAAGGYFASSSGYGVYGSASSASDFGGYFSNSTATTSGGALYANGDAKQSLTGDGFVKAGLYMDCGDAASRIIRSFNNVNTTPITVINGASAGRCTVDFGFNVSNRYISALPFAMASPRTVTFVYGSTDNRLDFFRFDQNGSGLNGGIMIMLY